MPPKNPDLPLLLEARFPTPELALERYTAVSSPEEVSRAVGFLIGGCRALNPAAVHDIFSFQDFEFASRELLQELGEKGCFYGYANKPIIVIDDKKHHHVWLNGEMLEHSDDKIPQGYVALCKPPKKKK